MIKEKEYHLIFIHLLLAWTGLFDVKVLPESLEQIMIRYRAFLFLNKALIKEMEWQPYKYPLPGLAYCRA